MKESTFWSDWVVFAAIMMILVGAFNAIQGLAAILSDEYYVIAESQLLVFDFTAWGWITLAWGVVLVLAGVALPGQTQWAHWFAVVVVSLNAVAQVAFLAAFPLWSILIVALNVLVLFALTARWDVARAGY